MSHSNSELLNHILDEIRFVLHATNAKTKDELIENEILKRAVIRSLEIIGEAKNGDFGVKSVILRFSKYACVGGLKLTKSAS